MHTIEASKLFNNNVCVEELSLDTVDEVSLDFSNVGNIELKDITTLLDVQKVVILNKKKIRIENVRPEVLQVLEITGLYKTFSNMMTNPIVISKRLSLHSWK